MIGCTKCPRQSLDNWLCPECEAVNEARLAQRDADWEAAHAGREVVTPVNSRERTVGGATEYRCRDCGEWSKLDEWQCLGVGPEIDLGNEWFGPGEVRPYSGDDAIDCPRCGERQPTPGLIPAQLQLEFES